MIRLSLNCSLWRPLLAVMIGIALSGCVGGSGMAMAVHGNFCGPNHPKLPAHITDRKAALTYLASIEPTDDLDRECKRHDMCYAERGAYFHVCDVRMRMAMQHFKSSFACRARAWNLRAGLAFKPMVPDTEGNTALGSAQTHIQTTGGSIAGAVGAVVASPRLAFNAVAQAGTETCNGTFDEAKIAELMATDRQHYGFRYGAQSGPTPAPGSLGGQ